jgi:N-acyl-D-aspartate/D-glutamate deacylase
MVEMLGRSLDSGGLGFSTSRAFTHKDGAGDPVASRWATQDEVLALCREVGAHAGTTLEFIFDGCLKGFSEEEVELASAMSLAANRPANWNVLTISAADETGVRRQIAACEAAAAKGARVVALTMPVLVDLCMSFGSHCALHSLPGWGDVLSGPLEDRLARLRDPEVRAQLQRGAHSPEAGVLRGVTNWASYRIGDTTAPELAPLRDRTIAEVAAERGGEAFDTLLDIVIADELRTILWPAPRGNDDESWKLRREAWESPYVMLGGSDAGAHLDRMCGSPYPTMFLADVLRGRRLVSIERAVEMLTSEPASLFGLRGRGRIEVGSQADLVLLDPSKVDATPARAVEDLPDGSLRLVLGQEILLKLPPEFHASFELRAVDAFRQLQIVHGQFGVPFWRDLHGRSRIVRGGHRQRTVTRSQEARSESIPIHGGVGENAHVAWQLRVFGGQLLRQRRAHTRKANWSFRSLTGAHQICSSAVITLLGTQTADDRQLVGVFG